MSAPRWHHRPKRRSPLAPKDALIDGRPPARRRVVAMLRVSKRERRRAAAIVEALG